MDTIRGLSKVRVSKEFLLGKLTINKESHEKAYSDILEARHKKVVKAIEEELEKVKKDKSYQPNLNHPLPSNHTKDYERAIGMLVASLDTEFELTAVEFDQYVNDEWSWKSGFVTISGSYIPPK